MRQGARRAAVPPVDGHHRRDRRRIEADLAVEDQSGRQRWRRLDQSGQRGCALRPAWRRGLTTTPERGRRRVQRRIQVIAQSGGERLFVAPVGRKRIQRRRKPSASGLSHKAGQRARLGGHPTDLFVDFAGRLTRCDLSRLSVRTRRLRRLQRGAGASQGRLRIRNVQPRLRGLRIDDDPKGFALATRLVQGAVCP